MKGNATEPEKPTAATIQREAADLLARLNGFPDLVIDFIDAIDCYQCDFGKAAVGSPDFVRLMKSGRSFELNTIKKVLNYISKVEIA